MDELNNKNDKLISMMAAIDICRKKEWNGTDDYLPMSARDIESEIRALPSSQPTFELLSMEEFVKEISPTTPDTIVKWLGLARHIYGMGYVICRE